MKPSIDGYRLKHEGGEYMKARLIVLIIVILIVLSMGACSKNDIHKEPPSIVEIVKMNPFYSFMGMYRGIFGG